VVSLKRRSDGDVVRYGVDSGAFVAALVDGSRTVLCDAGASLGYRGAPGEPSSLLLQNNGLGIEIVIDPACSVGATDNCLREPSDQGKPTCSCLFTLSFASLKGPPRCQ
jgi:hypothetical protein